MFSLNTCFSHAFQNQKIIFLAKLFLILINALCLTGVFLKLPHSQSQERICVYMKVLKDQIVPDALEEYLRRYYLKKAYQTVK